MGRLVIAGVEKIDGRLYFRRRWRDEAGKRVTHRIRLPALDDPGFAEALARASHTGTVRPKASPGTIAALVVEFRAAIRHRKLAPATRRNYALYLDRIAAEHGPRTVAGMRPAHCYKIRDGLAETPGVARVYMSVLRLLLAYACERDWRADNPAAGIKALPIGEHEPWPAELLTAALDKAPPMLRLAIVIGLTTGQRIGDCIRLQHAWEKGGVIELTQEKTGALAAFPVHPLLTAELSKVPRRALTMLYDRSGHPFGGVEPIQARIRRMMEDIGQDGGYSFHGLRKNACCYLLETGLNDAQVGSLLGMSAEMVRHYGKRARALMVAHDVAKQLAGATPIPIRGHALQKPIK